MYPTLSQHCEEELAFFILAGREIYPNLYLSYQVSLKAVYWAPFYSQFMLMTYLTSSFTLYRTFLLMIPNALSPLHRT